MPTRLISIQKLRFFFIPILLLTFSYCFSRTIYSKCDGYWDDPNTWVGYTVPEAGDSIFVKNYIRFSSDIVLINNYLNISSNSNVCGKYDFFVTNSFVIIGGTLSCSVLRMFSNTQIIILSTGCLQTYQITGQGTIFGHGGALATGWNGICSPIVNPCADFAVSDSIICEGSCINFYDFSSNDVTNWLWEFEGANILSSDVRNPQNICFSNSGIYSVKLTVSNDYGSNTIYKNQMIHVLGHSSSTIFLTECNNYISPSGNYNWTNSGIYLDTVPNDNNCDSVIIIHLAVEYCSCMFVPNAFTPNGDGLNDFFFAVVTCPYTLFQLSIFNRWGKKLFYTNNPNEKWNGYFNNKKLPADVYTYQILYQFDYMNDIVTKFGTVTLIR